MYWKEKDSVDTRERRIHEGSGKIKTRGFFDGISRLPIHFQKWELGPEVSEGNHVHEGPDAVEEVYYFLEGRGVMQIEGEDVPVAAGDAVLIPPGVDHGFRNTGDDPLKLVIIWGKPKV